MAELKRQLVSRDLVLMYVVAILSPRWIAFAAATGPASLTLWIAAGLFFFVPQALCVTALSSAFPQEGGLYTWAKRAFGDFHGFVAGWCYWVNNLFYYPSLALATAGMGLYVFGTKYAHLEQSRAYGMIGSLVLIGIAVAASVVGWRSGKWLQNLGGAANWLPIVFLLVIAALTVQRFGPANPISFASLVPRLSDLALVLAFSKMCFAFAGFELAPIVSEEIVEPRRTIPRAIFLSAISIAFVYLAGTLALLVALPTAETSIVTGINQAVTTSGARVGLDYLGAPTALLMWVAGLGALVAWFAGNGRLLFVAGLDRYLPPAFTRIHPRWSTPALALLVQGALAIAFTVLATGGSSVKNAYLFFADFTLVLYFIPYLYMFASGIVLRREVERAPGSVPIPGGALGSTVVNLAGFVVTALAIVLSSIPPADEERKSLRVFLLVGGAIAFVAIGVGLYALAVRRGRRA
ncbi:MAG TPA: APC family permease [Thermoanaerobaculia bacterium]|nr:APC family permease [Thermoanaerobaculia bacterium]